MLWKIILGVIVVVILVIALGGGWAANELTQANRGNHDRE